MSSRTYLVIDLGAGSGRVAAIQFDGERISIEEVNRFTNIGIQLPTGWHWNLGQLFADIQQGLTLAVQRYGSSLVSISADTWGVDYGLVDKAGRLLGLPWMYRDSRTDGMMDAVANIVPRAEIYERTGIQFLFFNTIYQLFAESRQYPEIMREAARLLLIPDLLAFWLSGVQTNERTNASTSQLLLAGQGEWDLELVERLGIPTHLLGPLTEPGTTIGTLLPSVQEATGCPAIKVVACGSHDSASAVAGVPAREEEPLFLSSGTWSLLGREVKKAIVTEAGFAAGFSNEQGVGDTVRYLKNVAGMWLLQECKRNWDKAGNVIDYGALVEQARASEATGLLDPNDDCFSKPCDMPAVIGAYLERTGQTVVTAPGDLARIILRSLALKYRAVIEELRPLTSELPETLYIVGGGCQNELLNQMTADATGLRVEAGPVEATAAGNALAQMMADGQIASLSEGRAILRASFTTKVFLPQDDTSWEEAEQRLAEITARLA